MNSFKGYASNFIVISFKTLLNQNSVSEHPAPFFYWDTEEEEIILILLLVLILVSQLK